jgi:hypothetical protein
MLEQKNLSTQFPLEKRFIEALHCIATGLVTSNQEVKRSSACAYPQHSASDQSHSASFGKDAHSSEK